MGLKQTGLLRVCLSSKKCWPTPFNKARSLSLRGLLPARLLCAPHGFRNLAHPSARLLQARVWETPFRWCCHGRSSPPGGAARSAAPRDARPFSQHAPLCRRRPGSCRRQLPAGSRDRNRVADCSRPGNRARGRVPPRAAAKTLLCTPQIGVRSGRAPPPAVYDPVFGVCKCWVRDAEAQPRPPQAVRRLSDLCIMKASESPRAASPLEGAGARGRSAAASVALRCV